MAPEKHGHPRLSTSSILRLQTPAHGCTRLLLRLGITNGVLCSRHSARTQSTYGMQCSTPHQCVSSKPISFQTPDGTRLAKVLPTPMCLMSFGADLAPKASDCILNTFVLRLPRETASVERVVELVQEGTYKVCDVVPSPIAGAARHVAISQHSGAALCPPRVTNCEVQQLIRSAGSVVFLSPPLNTPGVHSSRRCVEGSLLAIFSKGTNFVRSSQLVPVLFCLLHPEDAVQA